MDRGKRWLVVFAGVLLTLSVAVYAVRYLVFGMADEMLRYLMDDIAFIPIQALLVTLVLEAVLARRDRSTLLQKLNMVVGAFFSEAGRPLVEQIVRFDADTSSIADVLQLRTDWGAAEFAAARGRLVAYDYKVDASLADLEGLRAFLASKRDFILGLLENPNLLEHESFTELLWAVLHLQEELAARTSLAGLPPADLTHLSGDMARAYHHLLLEWLRYLEHLSARYPYLYSLAVRTNPFDPNAEAGFAS